jgi:hypothetical protein
MRTSIEHTVDRLDGFSLMERYVHARARACETPDKGTSVQSVHAPHRMNCTRSPSQLTRLRTSLVLPDRYASTSSLGGMAPRAAAMSSIIGGAAAMVR